MAMNNILQYESTIWATADLLRGCGIKESEWPSFMTPFFALVMILNKRKASAHEDRVMLINASEKFKPLKKNKGSKRKDLESAIIL
jgi:hypothetical protein